LLTTTNVALPEPSWTAAGTNGAFQFGMGGTNASQRFFRLRAP
jgi:hypothetical protein